MKRIILASQSPRRKEILNNLKIPHEIYVPDIDEQNSSNLSPLEYVNSLSLEKAKFVFQKINSDCIIISADTIVILDGEILGKPKSKDDAFKMLSRLSGNTHDVVTSVTILNCTQNNFINITQAEKTSVSFRSLTDEEILKYIDSGEPFDKAGAYGIQGLGAVFVERFEGDFYNVVGLPVKIVYKNLLKLGYDLKGNWS